MSTATPRGSAKPAQSPQGGRKSPTTNPAKVESTLTSKATTTTAPTVTGNHGRQKRLRVGTRGAFTPMVDLTQTDTGSIMAVSYAIFVTASDADINGLNNVDYEHALVTSDKGSCICKIYIIAGATDGIIALSTSAMLSLGFSWPGHPDERNPTVRVSLFTDDIPQDESFRGRIVATPFLLPEVFTQHAFKEKTISEETTNMLVREISRLWDGAYISNDSIMIVDVSSDGSLKSLLARMVPLLTDASYIAVLTRNFVTAPANLVNATLNSVLTAIFNPERVKSMYSNMVTAVTDTKISLIGIHVQQILDGGLKAVDDRVLLGKNTTLTFSKTPSSMSETYNEIFVSVKKASDNPVPVAGYDDTREIELVGNADVQYKKLVSAIVVPLLHPEFYYKFNTTPPKGVLLFGPPGTGKTFLLRKLASSYKVQFNVITASKLSEIASKDNTSLVNALDTVFKDATPPAVVFFDEFDGLFGTIGSDPEESTTTYGIGSPQSLMTHLLTIMDGFDSQRGIIVVGATNRPETLDPALRRPGRFDTEISFQLPDSDTRLKMLRNMVRRLNGETASLSEDDFDILVDQTRGFTPADLEGLARYAVQDAVETSGVTNLALDGQAVGSQLSTLKVTMQNFIGGLSKITPSNLRGLDNVIRTSTKWSDIGGNDDMKRMFTNLLYNRRQFQSQDRSVGLNVQSVKGIMLWGPPGTGKTLTASAIANECGYNFISVKSPSIFSKWIGTSEGKIRALFANAKAAAPCIIFFDEIDVIAGTRGGDENSAVTNRVVATLLTEMDALDAESGDVVVIGATNRPGDIDGAIIRPGRFDLLVYIGLPSFATRMQVFVSILAKKGSSYEYCFSAWEAPKMIALAIRDDDVLDTLPPTQKFENILFRIAQATKGCSNADIQSVCRIATDKSAEMLRGNMLIAAGEGKTSESRRLYRNTLVKVLSANLLEAAFDARRSVGPKEVKEYAEMRVKFDPTYSTTKPRTAIKSEK